MAAPPEAHAIPAVILSEKVFHFIPLLYHSIRGCYGGIDLNNRYVWVFIHESGTTANANTHKEHGDSFTKVRPI